MVDWYPTGKLYTVQPVLSGQAREVAKVAAKARWLLKSGVVK